MDIRTQKYIVRKVDELNFIREKEPFLCGDQILLLQEDLIVKISNVERKVRSLNIEIDFHSKELKRKREIQLTKSEATQLKNKLQNLRDKKEYYEEINYIFHHIGDGLAYLLIDRWDVKPLSFKQSPGFISGKKGARLERKCLRAAFKLGGMAILNDITNCLRYGDLTVVSKDRPFMILEIKSGKTLNKRMFRQMADIENITNYLSTDKTNFLYEKATNAVRIESGIKPQYHVERFNDFLNSNEPLSIHNLEKGYNLIIGKGLGIPEGSEEIQLGDKPILLFINAFRYSNTGYYPLSLLFSKGQHFVDFYTGKMLIGVAIDFGMIEENLKRNGFLIKLTDDEEYPYIIQNLSLANDTDLTFKVSYHFFNRMFLELLTLESFCSLLINLINSTPNNASMPTAS